MRDLVTTSSIDNNLALGEQKNKIINGNMTIWQRGSSFSIPNADSSGYTYTADRWGYYIFRNTGTLPVTTVARAVSNPNDTPGFRNALQFNINGGIASPGINALYTLNQMIEDVDLFTHRSISLSFWAQASSNYTIGLMMQQNFGKGSGGSANNTFLASAVTVGTTWQRYTVNNVPLPSLNNTVLNSTVNTSGILLSFILQSGSTAFNTSTLNVLNSINPISGWIQITGVQVEEGIYPTNFENRLRQAELDLCMRYYEKSNDVDTAPGTTNVFNGAMAYTAGPASASSVCNVQYKVPKRATPNITTYSVVTGLAGYLRNTFNNTDIPSSITNAGLNGFVCGSSTSLNANNTINFHWTAESEF